MADFTHRPNTGSLLRNKHKTEGKHPDWKGNGMVNGKLVDIAIWGGARRPAGSTGFRFRSRSRDRSQITPFLRRRGRVRLRRDKLRRQRSRLAETTCLMTTKTHRRHSRP